MLPHASNTSHKVTHRRHLPLPEHRTGAADQDRNCRDRGRFGPQKCADRGSICARGEGLELSGVESALRSHHHGPNASVRGREIVDRTARPIGDDHVGPVREVGQVGDLGDLGQPRAPALRGGFAATVRRRATARSACVASHRTTHRRARTGVMRVTPSSVHARDHRIERAGFGERDCERDAGNELRIPAGLAARRRDAAGPVGSRRSHSVANRRHHRPPSCALRPASGEHVEDGGRRRR